MKQFNIQAFKDGDMAAFEQLYQSYVGRIFNYINSIAGNVELSKDITQNAFIQIWDSRHLIDENGNLGNYIYTTARNLLFHEIRRLNVCNKYVNSEMAVLSEAESPKIDEQLSRAEIERQILTLLLDLPESRRNIFLMRWSKGMSNKEIAKELSISEKTVSTQIHRTVDFLKSRLGSIFMVIAIMSSIKF